MLYGSQKRRLGSELACKQLLPGKRRSEGTAALARGLGGGLSRRWAWAANLAVA